MVRAVARLFAIAVMSIMVGVLAVLFVRRMGSMQNFAEPSHVWFKSAHWTIYTPPPDELCAPTFQPSASLLVEITTRYKNNVWEVTCPDGPRPLAELLSHTPVLDWVLKVEAVDTAYLDKLVDIVGPHDKTMRFAILSSSQRVARYLRKKSPQWLFAADSATLLRLQLFESLWIEPAVDFWPDFVVTPESVGSKSALGPRAAEELRRRHKRIIWDARGEPVKPTYPIHGTITTLGLPK